MKMSAVTMLGIGMLIGFGLGIVTQIQGAQFVSVKKEQLHKPWLNPDTGIFVGTSYYGLCEDWLDPKTGLVWHKSC